jgi:hypothetical protein
MNLNLKGSTGRLTLVVAAGLAGVLAVGGGAYALTRARVQHGTASFADASAEAPRPTGSAPTAGGSATASPVGSTGAKGSTTAKPPAGTTSAEFAGVRLPLPAGWKLVVTTGFSGLLQGCVLPPGSRGTGQRSQDCTIVVRSFMGYPPPEGSADAAYFFADPDAIGGFADDPGPSCPGDNGQLTQPVRHPVTVNGRAGEYRAGKYDCASGADFAVQQWAFTDYPNVVLTSYTPPGSPLRTAVGGIVQGTTMPTGTGVRTTDFGLLTGYRAGSGGAATVTLDREVAGSPFGKQNDGSPADENDNPRTYPLRLASGVLIRSAIGLCNSGNGVTMTPRTSLGTQTCTRAQLQAALANGSAGPVWIKYDAQGEVTAIIEAYRP